MMRALTLCAAIAAAIVSAPLSAQDFPVAFGVADLQGSPASVTLPRRAERRAEDLVTLVLLDPATARFTLSQRVLGPQLVPPADQDPEQELFLLLPGPEDETVVGFAFAKMPALIVSDDLGVGVDVTGDGTLETLSACLTGEGIMLTVKDRADPAAEPLWDSYIALGYDVEPTCP